MANDMFANMRLGLAWHSLELTCGLKSVLGHGEVSLRMKARDRVCELLGGTWFFGSLYWNFNRSWLRVVTPFGEIPPKLDQSEIYLVVLVVC